MEKGQDKTNDVQIEIEKGEEEKKRKKNIKNARKRTARKGNTHTQGSQGGGGGVAPRQSNRITDLSVELTRIFYLNYVVRPWSVVVIRQSI